MSPESDSKQPDAEPDRGRDPTEGLFQRLFTVDLRSLAALRIGLGILILWDLALRSNDLTAHYTDLGVTTGTFLTDQFGQASYLSLHYWVGSSSTAVAAVFIVHALFAIGLLVGFRARLMALACWCLGASLLKRNPSLYTAGDAGVMFLLFWSMFLPISAKYSVDEALDPRSDDPPNPYFSVATVAILLQVCFTYWFAAGLKLGSPMWIDGSALHNALHRDWVVDGFGIWLRQFETILPIMAFGALIFEIGGPFLAFFPRSICAGRLLAISLFALLHVGFAISFHFGIFQWQAFAGWIVFLPACFWDYLGARILKRPSRNIRCYYDGDCGFCKKALSLVREFAMFPRAIVHKAQDDEQIHEEMIEVHSWIIVDHRGKHHHRWEALCYLLRRHPLTWIFGVVFAFPGVSQIGLLIYRWIANHRNQCGWMIAWLRWRQVRIQPTVVGSVLAFWIITYVFLLNVRTLHPEFRRVIPVVVAAPARALQIDPRWAMFTSVDALDGWVVLNARLADGSRVDLLTGEAPSEEKPELISHRYGSMRWMKLTQSYAGMQNKDTTARWAPYGERFAKQWDDSHNPSQRVIWLEVYYMEELIGSETEFRQYIWAEIDRSGGS